MGDRGILPSIMALTLLSGCAPSMQREVAAVTQSNSVEEVRSAAAEFVSAFNALDQSRFDALWADDASVFFPQPPFPIRRVDGKIEVIAWFKRFMDSQRSAGKSPGVDPKQLHIQAAGSTMAIVTFHLGDDPKAVARRTLVYRRDASGWRIVHLHGSALSAK